MINLPKNIVCGTCKFWDRGFCTILKYKTCGIFGCLQYEKKEKKLR